MAKGRWKLSKSLQAEEIFSILLQKKRPTRSLTKEVLLKCLKDTEVSIDFLKLCLEWDDSENLKVFRTGLLFVTKAKGATHIAKLTGISRITLYRMLSPKGNPRLNSLMSLLRALKCHVWVVDEDFIKRRERVPRPKDYRHARG